MKERKKLCIQDKSEEKSMKFRHVKKTGNPVLDMILKGKRVLTYLGVAFIVSACVYVLFDFSLQEKLVAAIEGIFF